MKTSRFLPASIVLAVLAPAAAQAQLITAGTLYVDLRATNSTAGSNVWLNAATGFGADMNFTNTVGAVAFSNDVANTAVPGVFFNGAAAYTGPRTVPDLEGASDRSVEVWAFNPVVGDEETLVSWSHRGGNPDGSNLSINYGSNTGFGAVGHWGSGYDVGWGAANNVPPANTWHHFVYTYAGLSNASVYVDGILKTNKSFGTNILKTWANEPILIGAQRGGTNQAGNSLFLNGYINSIRIHGGVLDAAGVMSNYLYGLASPPTPVGVRGQPQNLTVGESSPATFNVGVIGTLPVTFQWYRNGAPITDATNVSYTITNTTLADSGALFSCAVSNFLDGVPYTAQSSNGLLTVLSTAQALSHRWSFTSDASDSVGGAPGTVLGSASISGGQLRLTNVAGSYMALPTRLIDGLTAVTIEFWASYGVNGNFARTFDFGSTNGNNGIRYMFFTHRGGASNVLREAIMDPIATEKNTSTTLPGTVQATFDTRTNQHIVVVYDPQNGFMGFYTNSVLASSRTDLTTLSNVDNVYSFIGRSLFAGDPLLNGSIDELRMYSARLGPAQIATNFLNGPNAGFTNVPVTLIVDAPDRTVAESDTAQFFVTANGEGPIAFQWYRNGTALAGATNRNYALVNANLNDSFSQFTCVMSNFVASSSTAYVITSRVANLTVVGPATSLTHRYKFDTDANDSVGTAHGNLTNSLGGALPTLTNGAVALSGAAQFVDLPNNLVNSYNSFTVEAWVTDAGSGPWARIADFGNSTAGEGGAGTGLQYFFLSSPTGPGGLRGAITDGSGEQLLDIATTPLTFGVQKHVAWTTDAQLKSSVLYVDGAVVRFTNLYTLTPASIGPTVNNWIGRSQFGADAFFSGRIHEFRVYNSALPPAQIAASYTLGPDYIISDGAPQFPLQPTSRTVGERQSTTFSTVVVGRRPLALQWYRNGVLIPNATNASYTLASAAMADDNAVFQLWATNNVFGITNEVASSAAILTVNADTNAPFVVRVQNVGTGAVEILFSESVAATSATNPANYAIAGLAVNSASISADGAFVTLATDPLVIGNNYTLTISNQLDTAAIPNALAPDPTVVSFKAYDYALREIGSPGPLGSITNSGNGYDFTGAGLGAGNGVARTNDQFTLAYQNITGNFDVQVRLGALNLSDVWSRAGLMARDGFTSNATFAATWATPTVAGAFFQSRTTVNAVTQLSGNFPVNYPNTWLRLRRVGNVFDGFASIDGQTWSFLGTATIAMSATAQVGLAVSANSSVGSLVTQFRDIGTGAGTIATNLVLPFEPLAASSRKTALIFSEIMYNPPDAWGGSNNLEWVEIYNTGVIPEDLTGHKIRGDISYDFPDGTTIQPGQFLLVARNPSAFSAFYGRSALGPWSGNLPNNGGTLRLNNELGGRMLEVEYDNELSWPVAADGTGHSLVLRKPSYGENDARAWTASTYVGGSPGANDPAPLNPTVVINEFLQDTNSGFVELKNVTGGTVDISGYILTDNPNTNRFTFPPSTTIAANSVLSVDAATLGFAPDPTDGHLYVLLPFGIAVVDAVEFGPYAGAARGRYPDGSPYWSEMSSATPGGANATPLQRDLVINEIMYHPISESNNDEYIEIYNRGTNTISLDGWRVRGGIDFNFPSNAMIGPGSYVVVAENLTNLLAKYTNLTTVNTFGNYSGNLGNGGERVALQMPVQVGTNTLHATINEVTYRDGGRWGLYSDGGGSSLELIDPRTDNRFAANWADSDESAKAPWTTIDKTDFLLNGQTDQAGTIIANGAPNRLEFFLQDVGEVLVDNVEIRNNGGANLIVNTGFENGTNGFFFGGTHRRTFVQAGAGIGGSNAMHVVSTGRGDAGPNKVSAPITQLTVNNPLLTGTPAATNTGTIRAQVRWLKGSPYVMFRTRGHWMEATLRLNLPTNLGTPGAPNSRLVANAGPAISETTHTPVLPAAGQPVVVTARIADPDSIGGVTLRYRLDATNPYTYTNVTMVDNGTAPDARAGDGIYSGTIPGFPANALVAFHIIATDAAPVTATAIFPSGFPTQECLVRFGETQIAGGLGTYRLWVHTNNVNVWSIEGTAPGQRERNANDPIDATFVYGANRVVYNVGTLYSGSPFHTANAPYNGPGAPDSPICDYEINFPSDDKFLGTEPFVLSAFDVNQAVGTFFADRAVQNEATGNWLARKLGQQYNHRRHVYVVFNGSRRGTIYEDAQQPNGDMLEEYYPNDSHGELRKIEDWFEFANDGQAFTVNTRNDIGSQSAYMLRINDNSGAVDAKRYRWTFRPRSTDNPNDWYNLTNMIVAVNTPGNGADYVSNTLAWIDMRNFMRPIATHHLCGDWDSFGYERGKNMFAYKGDNSKWKLLIWDIELGLGHSQSRLPTDGIYRAPHEPMVTKMFTNATFQREYLCALLEGCNGPFAPGVADVLLDARYASFVQNNLPVISPDYIKSFMAARRSYVLSQIPSVPFSVDGPSYFETTNAVVTFTGLAPVSVKDIVLADGRAVSPAWITVTQWTGNVAIAPGTNVLTFRALDAGGVEISNVTVTVVFNGIYPWPQLRINEWMANNGPGSGFTDPADGDYDDWFELYNPTAAAVDINGWYLSDAVTNKLQYRVTTGYVIPAGGYRLIWADGETGQNLPTRDLHVNFQLRAAGEEIVLTAPDGTIIDHIAFGQQTNNVSQGRSPDGGTNITFQYVPTPGSSNYYVVPVISEVIATNNVVSFRFSTTPGHTYRVEYKDDFSGSSWTPLGNDQTAGDTSIGVTTTNGTPQRFYHVRVID